MQMHILNILLADVITDIQVGSLRLLAMNILLTQIL